MKFAMKRPVRVLLTLMGFYCCYLVSTVAATVLTRMSITEYFEVSLASDVACFFAIALVLFCTKLYASSYRHAGIFELMKTLYVALGIFVVNTVIMLKSPKLDFEWNIVCIITFSVIAEFVVGSYRIFTIYSNKHSRKGVSAVRRVLIVGAGYSGAVILGEIVATNKLSYKPVGFVDDNKDKHGMYLSGVKVLGGTEDIKKIVDETRANLIIIAIPSADAKSIKRISELCIATGCETKVLPGIYQLLDGEVSVSRLRSVDVQDLLGRDPVKVNLDEVMGYIEGKVVMVTGGGGSIGSELCRQIAAHNPAHLIILDIYENNAYEIEQELIRSRKELKLTTLIASIRDRVKMEAVFDEYRPEIVFHAAAHKHVPLMETSPAEAVKNNIFGTYNLACCADRYGVSRFVQISTDKAVNPTNIMGATKRVCEMIIQKFARHSKTRFVAVRFGNVLGSNGSVIPLFKKQIAEGGPVTVTHKDIIRYFMTIPEAVSLVLQAGAYAEGGEIFVLDMGEQVKIYDLAENLIRLMGYEPHEDIEIKITGLRPGEKLYEERLMAEEGMKKTQNDRISIGKPIDFDEKELEEKLAVLRECVAGEGKNVKVLVKELVPSYKIYDENKA